MLNGADELARFEQAVMCASIEPSITAAHALNVQRAHFHVEPVQIGDLQFTTGRRARSEEHTSELQSLMRISYAVFCLTKNRSDKRNPFAAPRRTRKKEINSPRSPSDRTPGPAYYRISASAQTTLLYST